MSSQPSLKRDSNFSFIQESYLGDLKFRGEYVAGNLIYKGYARPGADESESVWQIARLTYSGTDVTQVDWPQDTNGVASSAFKFVWDDRGIYTYN